MMIREIIVARIRKNNNDKNTDNTDAGATDNADNTSNNESVEAYRQAAQDIQYAVADGSLKNFPPTFDSR